MRAIEQAPTGWLLLRGLSREQRHWWSFPERFAEATGARMACLDLPGFGTEHARRSPASIAAITDDLRRRFDAERGGERWGILGISLGGMVALDWCARHADDFAACVTVNTSARPSSPLARFRPAGLRAVLGTLIADALAKERAVLRVTSEARGERLEQIAEQHARWTAERPPSRASVALQLRAAMRFSAPERVHAPVLVLASTTDRLVSHQCSARIAERVGARFVTCDRGGHDLALDEPEWICSQITVWIRASSEARLRAEEPRTTLE
jgi:pimeloyl-ACP methyl ester carboxylesterase